MGVVFRTANFHRSNIGFMATTLDCRRESGPRPITARELRAAQDCNGNWNVVKEKKDLFSEEVSVGLMAMSSCGAELTFEYDDFDIQFH